MSMIRVSHVAVVCFVIMVQAFAQNVAYDWNSDETTTRIDPDTHLKPIKFTIFDSSLTPVFVVNSQVCNSARAVVFELKSSVQNINYTILNVTRGPNLFTIDAKQRILLQNRANFTDTLINVSAKREIEADDYTDPLTAIHPSSSYIRVQSENFLQIRVQISDSFCPDSQSSATTIVIVTLSVLCIVFLTAFSLALIALRRTKPFLFGYKLKQIGAQVGPAGDASINHGIPHSPDVQGTGCMQTLSVNSILKPRKSSLKPRKRLPELPEVCVTMDETGVTTEAFKNEAFVKENEAEDKDLGEALHSIVSAGEVIAMNGMVVTTDGDEKRRPSTVTFNETTQIIEIGRKKR